MRNPIRGLRGEVRLGLLARKNSDAVRIIRKVVAERLSFLEVDALCDLVEVVLRNEETKTEGIIIDAGCALGGSAITLASTKSPERALYVYDVFGMIPSPSERDGTDAHERYRVIESGQAVGFEGRRYYGYEIDLFERVRRAFIDFGLDLVGNRIHLVKGLFQDTMRIESPVRRELS